MIQIYEIGIGINETKIKNNKTKAQTNGVQSDETKSYT